jgi:quercetin dioxygenase-like cupin family protein
MRVGEEVEEVQAGSVVRVAPGTTRSHRNEGEELSRDLGVSRRIDDQDATKVEDFWEASASAAR